MFSFTYKKVVNRPTPIPKPGNQKGKTNVFFFINVKMCSTLLNLVLTKKMLYEQFSTQYDHKRKTLLEPDEETA